MAFVRKKKFDWKSNDGSILMVVLWILAFLVLLGLGLGYSTSIDQRLVGYQRDRLMALYLAKAGYYRALAELEQDPTPKIDSYLDTWSHNPEAFHEAKLGEGNFTVSYPVREEDGSEGVIYGIMDEDRKVDVNFASQAVLLRLPGMTDEIVDAVLDWRAKHKGLGESLGEVKDKTFEVLEDIWLLEGMTPEAYQTLRPFITVYTDGKVNLNSAPREVLTAFNMEEDLVNKLLRFRKGLDNVRGTEDDQSFASLGGVVQQLNAFVEPLTPKEAAQLTSLISQSRLKVSSSVFRIHSKGAVGDGKIVRSVEGVVEQGKGASSPFTLLSL
ncbi:MAG: general secretion pathway protein GspK, partial [Deltaproteobacteria bacterium]|nr:general secretion pathway protein GspK [Deltaproteobacteria bacterium]